MYNMVPKTKSSQNYTVHAEWGTKKLFILEWILVFLKNVVMNLGEGMTLHLGKQHPNLKRSWTERLKGVMRKLNKKSSSVMMGEEMALQA